MAEEAIPSAADPLQSRTPSTRLPSLAELYAAQQLGQAPQTNSYTLPELYALEQTGAPLDLGSAPDTNWRQQSQSPAPQDQPLPILVDQSGAPLQPEPLTPGERIRGSARAAAHATVGDLADYLEALGRTAFGVAPKSTQALREANEGFEKVGKHPSEERRPSTIISQISERRGSASATRIRNRQPRRSWYPCWPALVRPVSSPALCPESGLSEQRQRARGRKRSHRWQVGSAQNSLRERRQPRLPRRKQSLPLHQS